MRVVAGTARGRRLVAPPGAATRPTSDRVKEALFSALGDVAGLRVLDLYAGSGALAIEALSRGAAAATLVESDRRALLTMNRNLATAGVAERATVRGMAVSRFCEAAGAPAFDLVLADPPYATALAAVFDAVRALWERGALARGATVVVERDRRAAAADDAVPTPAFLASHAVRAYGDTVLRWYGVATDDVEEPSS